MASNEQPLLLVEPDWHGREERERWAELAFEKFNVPALFFARSSAVTTFSAGRYNALVLDSGGGMTRAVPVYEGIVVKKAIRRQAFAGEHLSELILRDLEHQGMHVVPRYVVKSKQAVEANAPAHTTLHERPGTKDSYHRYMQMKVMDEFKESVCHVSETTYDPDAVSHRQEKSFEFPDGFNRTFKDARYALPEVLFQPKHFWPSFLPPPEHPLKGISELVQESLGVCDMDIKPHLYNCILLSGGNTLLNGFPDRINSDISQLVPGMKVRVHAPGSSSERKHAAWLGGSILSSLGSFHQMWVSRKEWEELGYSVIDKKCN
jgi:actin-related protein